MKSFQIYQNLVWLNDLPQTEAEAAFLDCCGSAVWARRMAEERPFLLLENLFETAERTWASLSPADRLEAFGANPVIGTQTGGESAIDPLREQLVGANGLYEDKFGFIFILCTVDRSSDEILAMCRARLGNSLETELMIAAEEQRKITEIGLNRLLEK